MEKIETYLYKFKPGTKVILIEKTHSSGPLKVGETYEVDKIGASLSTVKLKGIDNDSIGFITEQDFRYASPIEAVRFQMNGFLNNG